MPNVFSRPSAASVDLPTLSPSPCVDSRFQRDPVDPFLVIYRQWLENFRDYKREMSSSRPGFEDGFWDAVGQRQDELLQEMIAVRPTTLEGLAALVAVCWKENGPVSLPTAPDYQEQIKTPEAQVLIALWRAVTGRNDLPPSPYA